MDNKAFIICLIIVSLLLCVVAADTAVVISNRQFIDSSQASQNTTLEASCDRVQALRALDNVSHYSDWRANNAELQDDILINRTARGVSRTAAINLENQLRSAINLKAWVPATDCLGLLTRSSLKSPKSVLFNTRLPPKSALLP